MIAADRLPAHGDGRWLLIAASGRTAATEFADRAGLDVALAVDRHELLASPLRLRRRIAGAAVDAAAIHSVDWSRERAPQLAELALAVAPVQNRVLLDEATGEVVPFRRPHAARTMTTLPFDLALAGTLVAAATARSRGPHFDPVPWRGSGEAASVVAVWPLTSSSVGGAVTHMSGILGGLKRAGLRIGLAAAGPVPGQLAAVVDEVEVVPPLRRAHRISAETEQLASNRRLLKVCRRLGTAIGADFVYQRHRAFLDAGVGVSRELGIPLVLEWNSSEVWKRRNWDVPPLRIPPLDRLAEAAEERVVRAATLIAAVSTRAGAMAIKAGAPAHRVNVIPNAVDVARLEAAIDRGDGTQWRRDGRVVGWVGSFGPWHGAPVLVRALAHLPANVSVRMIGDGPERQEVERLAAELGVADRIEWAGALPNAAALTALRECDVLASPHVPVGDTPFFGSPTKLFEYMALGRPIVASRLEQIGEVLDDERTALLVEPGEVRKLAAAIADVLARPDRGAALGDAAAAEARQLHTWDRRASDLLMALTRAT